MKNKSILLGATVLALGAFAVLSQTAYAYKGDPRVQGPNYTPERHDAMTQALSKKDYNAWKSLVGNRGVVRKINSTNFARFAEAHQLALSGKITEANAIRAELGLGQQKRNGSGQGNGQGCRMNQ